MAVDGKYGKVALEHGSIGEDEPVVVFRARDKNLPALLAHYMQLCTQTGSPDRHLTLIASSYRAIREWQDNNPEAVKVPDSESSKSWMD